MSEVDSEVDPSNPCASGCQLGHGEGCFALRTTRRLCELIAAGREDYRIYVDEMTKAGADASEPSPPTLTERIASLVGAIGTHVAAGMPRATTEQRAARLAICRGCENYDVGWCKACGCYLRIKTSLATERCPLDPPLWDRLTSPSKP
jgi:hypothetical protein